jgi:hypothetical protein
MALLIAFLRRKKLHFAADTSTILQQPPFLAVPGLCMLRWRFTLRGVWGQLLAVCRRL